MADLNDKIRKTLGDLGLEEPTISVDSIDRSVIATILSRSFSGMDEAERQKMVWRALRQNLDDHERVAVEFVFTVAPDEQESVDEAI